MMMALHCFSESVSFGFTSSLTVKLIEWNKTWSASHRSNQPGPGLISSGVSSMDLKMTFFSTETILELSYKFEGITGTIERFSSISCCKVSKRPWQLWSDENQPGLVRKRIRAVFSVSTELIKPSSVYWLKMHLEPLQFLICNLYR